MKRISKTFYSSENSQLVLAARKVVSKTRWEEDLVVVKLLLQQLMPLSSSLEYHIKMK